MLLPLALLLTQASADVTVTPGALPLVITVPHGGIHSPDVIPSRTDGVTERDMHTAEFGRELGQAIALRFGAAPFEIVNELHRRKLDPNREIGEAAAGDKRAEAAWLDYHEAVELSSASALKLGAGGALLIDLHGHGHAEGWVELGYGVSKSNLAKDDNELEDAAWLRGPLSLGAFLQASSIAAVPSPKTPHPDGKPYFTGGYTIRRHRGDGLRSIQIELPRVMRNPEDRVASVNAVADALSLFLAAHFAVPRIELGIRTFDGDRDVPDDLRVFSGAFHKYTRTFGVPILATSSVPNDKLNHATNVLAEYLDNNEDGVVDDARVLQALINQGAFLVMPNSENEMGKLERNFEDWHAAGWSRGQDLFAFECLPSDSFDATLEEVWHLVSVGWTTAYPASFSYEPGSRLTNAMDKARGGHFERIPRKYPEGAWYRYRDRTCEYDCQAAEYFYWGLTSLLGAQASPMRAREIEHEWLCATPDLMRALDPTLTALLEDLNFNLPTTLPAGNYRSE